MRIFWSLSPTILILFGVIAALNNGISPHIFLLNLILLFTFFYLNIYIHEYGHVIAARLMNIRVAGVIIGNGKKASYGKIIFGIPLIITNSLVGGLTLRAHITNKHPKLSAAFISLGGVLLQFVITIACVTLFGIKDFSYLFGGGISFSTVFIFSNALEIAFNLFPSRGEYFGVKLPSDGLKLMKLPFLKIEEITEADKQSFAALEEKLKTIIDEINKSTYNKSVHTDAG